MVFLLAATKGAIEVTAERTLPALFHKPRVICGQPLERVSELLAVLISGDRGHRRNPSGGTAGLRAAFHELELIHEFSIADNRVDGGDGKILMLRGKL
jgi:hypothetical protein